MKIKLMAFAAGLLSLAIVGSAHTSVQALDSSRDCDKYSIIKCGTMTSGEIRSEYDSNNASNDNGSTTTQSDIKKVFSHFGISRSELSGSFKPGIVYKNGNVTVDGKVVATDAMMGARHLGGKAIAGTTASEVSVSQMGDSQTALVKFDANGKFLFAVMKPCGNPVTAKPKVTPPPTPPKTPSVTVEKFVDTDKKYKQVAVNVEYAYRIVVTNTGNVDLTNVAVTDTPDQGITLVSVSGSYGKIENNSWTYTIANIAKGASRTFTLNAKVPQYLAGRVVNTVCVNAPAVPGNPDKCDKAEVDVPPPVTPGNIQVCVLADKSIQTISEADFNSALHSKNLSDCKEEEVPEELPQTGPVEVIMQIVGAMSLVSASAYYVASRRGGVF